MHRNILVSLGCLAWTLSFAGTITADDAPLAGKVTDVGVQQQRIQRDFQEMEQKVLRVISDIQETDPERARQLQSALDWAREKILSGRLGSAADLLNANKLVEAREIQPGMTSDLEAMLRLFQEELSEYDRLHKRIEQLQEWLERTQALAREEGREMRDSEKAQDAETEKKRLDEQIARVERLLAAQKDLKNRAEKAQDSDLSKMRNAAEEQAKLEKETTALKEEMQNGGKSGQAGKSGQSGQSGQSGAKNEEAPDETRAPEAGEQALGEAAGEQAKSAENLTREKAKASVENQAKAIQKMEQALREMKQEGERQQKMDSQKGKADQDKTEQQTAALEQDMAQANNEQDGGQSGQSGQESQPGQSAIQQARQSMQQASKELGKNSPKKAAPEQKDAKDQLGKAAKELKKTIEELKDEEREALRGLLKELLEKMLVQQRAATLRTATLNEAKEKKKWTDERRQELGGVRESEEHAGQMADRVSNMVEQDGSSVVFGAIVTDLQQAFSNVVSLLAKEETGVRTRDTQREIENTIEELIKALEDNKEPPPPSEPKESDPKEQKPPPPPPLVALAQELRLLKEQQLRVNNRTAVIQKEAATTKQPEQKADLQRVSDQQRKIHDITKELLKKLSGRPDDAWDAI